MKRVFLGTLLAGLLASSAAYADSVDVAVAANFTKVAEELAVRFKTETGHDLVLSFGATGQLYTQITQGAPFEILLAADDERPTRAVKDGFGVDGSVFTYAIGTLALYSTSLVVGDGEAVLKGPFDKLAIADPEAAPYGKAAVQTLKAMGIYDMVAPRLVTGENISQTLQFVESGNAELGFVAVSQVMGKDSVWLVPSGFHEPIRQDAVLLKTGQANPAATAFIDFLKSDKAVAVIKAAGYAVD
ncbi:Molybdenum ABC transporter, periplasmic molybdenum-binding protein ModA [Devosia sp. LC5]|uniref:molybdate ABC transporter substrate-binding protein n=1 Tax=Devosia sp. LC5 TaxID=1502724 RepID=UPI0004E2BC96|nr:molybdate ABC transporter substrate-binding protein [Devosia sp. LC5]KFC62118.1 Molybdenum ABC transporter, periplasmic molybdenum-binding protein ModA [Devosia sp. LC5]